MSICTCTKMRTTSIIIIMFLIECGYGGVGKAAFGEKEWYFFSPRDRKYPNGSRPNRVAGSGYWKATGTDKIITTEGRKVGIKKALVFYIGKAPKGSKTNWIMHEYRLLDSSRKHNLGTAKVHNYIPFPLFFKLLLIISYDTKDYEFHRGDFKIE